MKKMYVRSLWAMFFSILFGIGAAAGAIGLSVQ